MSDIIIKLINTNINSIRKYLKLSTHKFQISFNRVEMKY